jgi:chromatin remodeling complex protein RSC6
MYIATHKLQDQQEKRVVNADSNLQRLFGKARVSLDEMAFMFGEHVVEASRGDST